MSTPIPGITRRALADAIRAAGHKNVVFRSSMQDGVEELLRRSTTRRCVADHRSRECKPGLGRVGRAPGSEGISELCPAQRYQSNSGAHGSGRRASDRGPILAKTSLGIGGTSDLLLIRKHEALPGLVRLLKQAGRAVSVFGQWHQHPASGWRASLEFCCSGHGRSGTFRIEGNYGDRRLRGGLRPHGHNLLKDDLGGMEGLIGVPGTVGEGAHGVTRALTGPRLGRSCARFKVYRPSTRPDQETAARS